jgi:hypothetical protein
LNPLPVQMPFELHFCSAAQFCVIMIDLVLIPLIPSFFALCSNFPKVFSLLAPASIRLFPPWLSPLVETRQVIYAGGHREQTRFVCYPSKRSKRTNKQTNKKTTAEARAGFSAAMRCNTTMNTSVYIPMPPSFGPNTGATGATAARAVASALSHAAALAAQVSPRRLMLAQDVSSGHAPPAFPGNALTGTATPAQAQAAAAANFARQQRGLAFSGLVTSSEEDTASDGDDAHPEFKKQQRKSNARKAGKEKGKSSRRRGAKQALRGENSISGETSMIGLDAARHTITVTDGGDSGSFLPPCSGRGGGSETVSPRSGASAGVPVVVASARGGGGGIASNSDGPTSAGGIGGGEGGGMPAAFGRPNVVLTALSGFMPSPPASSSHHVKHPTTGNGSIASCASGGSSTARPPVFLGSPSLPLSSGGTNGGAGGDSFVRWSPPTSISASSASGALTAGPSAVLLPPGGGGVARAMGPLTPRGILAPMDGGATALPPLPLGVPPLPPPPLLPDPPKRGPFVAGRI